VRVASPDVPIAPYSGILEEAILPNPEKIVAGIREVTSY
jgi:pyruvate/2-oxoglutarate/acetoin dehydrogenase E1 component